MRVVNPIAVVALLTLGTPGQVARADTSASFQVTANIQAGCLVDGAGGATNFGRLDFGQASAASTETRTASLTVNQSITLRCTPQTALSMAIDGGMHASGGVRRLQRTGDAASQIAYTLCADPGCAQAIGIATPLAISVTSTNANNINLPVYGRLTLPGGLAAGTYNDTLTVTLSW